jgi:hypothetical protein
MSTRLDDIIRYCDMRMAEEVRKVEEIRKIRERRKVIGYLLLFLCFYFLMYIYVIPTILYGISIIRKWINENKTLIIMVLGLIFMVSVYIIVRIYNKQKYKQKDKKNKMCQ